MNKLRQRKLIARENRQASLHSQGITVEKTSIELPQPKALVKKEIVKVEVKRGRGRPPKSLTKLDKKIAQVAEKTAKGKRK